VTSENHKGYKSPVVDQIVAELLKITCIKHVTSGC